MPRAPAPRLRTPGHWLGLVRSTKPCSAMGLGMLLMRWIIDYCKGRGIGEIYGDVLAENARMLKLCKVLEFEEAPIVDEPGMLRLTLKL